MRTFARLLIMGAVLLVALQLVRPSIPSKPATAEVQTSTQIRHILEKDCYSCHSDERRLSWFDEIVPGYWLVRHDILTAREHLDFSTLGSKPAAAQKAKLFEAVNMVQLGAMPLASFLKLHHDARVTPEELATLKSYLAPWSAPPPALDASALAAPGPISLAFVPPEFGGFPLDPAFEGWKTISATDRGDNNTFRSIVGNDIAVKSAQSGKISPWPDGTRFAKIAWQQTFDQDGLIHPGKLVQIEMMAKDAKRYKDTDGWGWGLGQDLKPFGEDAHFVNECTSCHLPVRGDDYVYTLPITAAKVGTAEVVNNRAALPGNLPYQPLAWDSITMYVDPRDRTMAILFGDETAMNAVRGRKVRRSEAPEYTAGTVLALVTWAQRDDPHWFGARIPDSPRSVEFLQVGASGQANSYRRFAGTKLTEAHLAPDVAAQRASSVLKLAPAWLP